MKLLGALLDRSIVFSFDRTGFERHAKGFDPADLAVSLEGRTCLVTGANSGLGAEVACALAERGATLQMLCRDVSKAADVRARIERESGSRTTEVASLDLSDFASIRRYVETQAPPTVDVLVHNAGVMPHERVETADGLELTAATNLVGPLLLTHLLWPRLSAGARIIHVSSGGMYAEKLNVETLLDPPEPFDGVKAYARTKRAQVVLTEVLAARSAFAVSSMHPGWADTPGVRSSMPRFHALTRRILRTPAQGADTIVWLAAAEDAADPRGRFYFDRSPAETHLTRRTVASETERARLFETLCLAIGADPATDLR